MLYSSEPEAAPISQDVRQIMHGILKTHPPWNLQDFPLLTSCNGEQRGGIVEILKPERAQVLKVESRNGDFDRDLIPKVFILR